MQSKRQTATGTSAGRVATPVVVLLGAILVAIGLGAGILLAWDPPPPLLALDSGATFQVTQESFDDSRTVPISVTVGDAQVATSPSAGRVTASSCKPGEGLSSGASTFSVNGVPLVNLATTTPMWRDIAIGDSGDDVKAIAAELTRLGFANDDAPQIMDRATVAAWRALAVKAGVPAKSLPANSVPQGLVVWLPSTSSTVESCGVQVGQAVSVGQTVATFDAPVVAASVAGQPTQLALGPRMLVIDDQTTLAVDAGGAISDRASLVALAASPTVHSLQALGQLDSLTGRYVLSTPLEVSVVPPTAIVVTNGSAGCVVGDGVPRAVTVVSSQLGQSLVQFTGVAPAVVAMNPPETLTCR